MDPNVTITKVSDQVGFDPVSLQPTRTKLITYMVGTHGPFNLTITEHDYTPERVQYLIDENIRVLRAIGAVQ